MSQDLNSILTSGKRLHFVGIGGSGMFPIVEILLSRGFQITGSDVNEGSIIDRERELGIPVTIPHSAECAAGADALIVTAALLPGNPEVAFAQEHNIPILTRAEVLGWITSSYSDAVCISGTHGKTTATSMLTSILYLAGRDPTAVIGGKLPLIGGYGRSGKSSIMTCEACEFVDTFLQLHAAYPVILNIDDDHLDYFGSVDGSIRSFRRFAARGSKAVLANGDDNNTLKALLGCPLPILLFGTTPGCDYRITDIKKTDRAFFSFTLHRDERLIGSFKLHAPGRHNIWNAAAAAAAADLLGCSAQEIADGLASFSGAARRFQILGTVRGITIADDYAHHPTELAATLQAAKEMGFKRVFALFQPFTYSRTKQHLDAFSRALSIADRVVMTEIMGSREVNTIGIYTRDLAEKIPGSVWFEGMDEAADYCLSQAEEGDLILTLGCGDIYKAAYRMVNE